MNAYMNQYQNNQVLNASPEQILIMLYDGAIRFVNQADRALADGRMADKAKAISKAIAIIVEFSNTLDRAAGGEIAEDLSRLYDFMIRELTTANTSNDAERFKPVQKILADLREAFSEAAIINRRKVQESQVASNSSEQHHLAASC